MKKFFNVLCFILMGVLAFGMAGCTKGNDESKAQEVVKKYVSTFYTIDKSDVDICAKMIAGCKPEEGMERDKAWAKYEEKFKSLMTDESFRIFHGSRMSYLRSEEAYKNKYYVKVKDVKLHKSSEDKNKKTITYNCDMELTQTSMSGNKTKDVKETKQIEVQKVGDSWKVDSFEGM